MAAQAVHFSPPLRSNGRPSNAVGVGAAQEGGGEATIFRVSRGITRISRMELMEGSF